MSQCRAMEAQGFQVLRQLPGAGSITLEGESLGEGPPVMLLHGLSATRRNVVQGSRALAKRGYRLISYDARGHGASSPAPSYEYGDLVAQGVLDPVKVTRSALVNAASIAGMLLTTETLVVEKPEEEEESAAAGHGHGHGH